jgi:alkanesulfonate monooxygenase SsuD/methylene tetrahydromethanopterin reductase-like flavin-dependent oxidoreductase (luciferase family)
MFESYTTLGFLAGVTSKMRLGTLVTGITYRNLAHLGKIVATLDVLSNGRAFCGLGAAWFAREHQLYGWEFPPVRHRYELLEDALQLLPLMWGPGSPPFEGRTTTVPEAICYPRPVQERIPIMIGGSGERQTLKLVAQYADACNLFGDASAVRHKVGVLRSHCEAVDRDPMEITVTQLSSPGGAPLDDEVGRYRELAEVGVQQAIVSLDTVEAIERFAPVVAAFG